MHLDPFLYLFDDYIWYLRTVNTHHKTLLGLKFHSTLGYPSPKQSPLIKQVSTYISQVTGNHATSTGLSKLSIDSVPIYIEQGRFTSGDIKEYRCINGIKQFLSLKCNIVKQA